MKIKTVLILTGVAATMLLTSGLAMAATRQGTQGNDTIIGTARAETMRGLAGNDTMRGRGGADRMYGNDGDDNMLGGQGSDDLDGGKNSDVMRGSVGGDTLYGGSGDDTLYGGRGTDVVEGGNGDDKLYGGSGGDGVVDYNGNNTISGGPGKDRIFVGLGTNRVNAIDGNEDFICVEDLMTTTPAYTQDAAQRLPDLRMAHLDDLKIRKASDGRRLLRFTAIMVNVGAGPFEAHGQRPDSDTLTMTVTQRIYNDAGGYRDVRTPAVMFFSGDGHDHWHIEDLQSYTLRGLDGQTSESVRLGAKQGFCVQDFYGWNGTLPGAPKRAEYRRNLMCGEIPEQEALEVPMGLSIGWSDVYGYYLPKQYIDITGLPSGRYRLYAVANRRGDFEESHEHNNYTWAKIELRGNKVKVLKEGPTARYCGLSGSFC